MVTMGRNGVGMDLLWRCLDVVVLVLDCSAPKTASLIAGFHWHTYIGRGASQHGKLLDPYTFLFESCRYC